MGVAYFGSNCVPVMRYIAQNKNCDNNNFLVTDRIISNILRFEILHKQKLNEFLLILKLIKKSLNPRIFTQKICNILKSMRYIKFCDYNVYNLKIKYFT